MRIKDPSTLYSLSVSTCMGAFVFGYQLTSFGNLKDLILHFNFPNGDDSGNTILLLNTILALSAIFGVGIYRWMIKSFGFVYTFKITDYFTVVAAIIGVLSLSVGVQACSRILFGIVVGINTVLVPTYLTSVLPGSFGGPCGTLNQLFITIGILFGSWFGLLVVDQNPAEIGQMSWRVIVGLPIIPALIRLHTSQNVYHYESVQNMIESGDDEILQHYLDLIYQDGTIEEFKQSKKLQRVDIQSQIATFFDPLSQSYRKRLFVSCGLIIFNQLSGGAALGYFGGSVAFLSVSDNQPDDILTVFIYLQLVQVIFTLIAGQLIEKFGMRSFMMEGIRIIIISLLLISFIQIFVPELHVFSVILIFIQMAGFSLSYGPCCFVLVTCIMHDIWLPSVILWIFIFLYGVSIQTFVDLLGIGTLCFIYFVIQIFGLLYISGFLIETCGKSRNELYLEFRKGIFPNPVRYLKQRFSGSDENKPKQTEIEMNLLDRRNA